MSESLVKQPATLLKIGKRAVSVYGFRHDLFLEHLQEHLSKTLSQQWCSVGCAARTMFGRNTLQGREAIRRRLGKVFRTLLDQHLFLIIEYAEHGHGHHGEMTAVKLWQGPGAGEKAEMEEQQHATTQLARMLRRRQITEVAMKKAYGVLQLPLPFDMLTQADTTD